MRIYMSFSGADVTRPAPTLTWTRSSALLELMRLSPHGHGGTVSLDLLKVGIERARAVLSHEDEQRPPYARKLAERRSLLVVLDLLERARLEARAAGATEFRWREDF